MGKQPNIQVLSNPAAEWARSNAGMFFTSGAASIEELLEQLSRGACSCWRRCRDKASWRVVHRVCPGRLVCKRSP
jgi:hypothetical protein